LIGNEQLQIAIYKELEGAGLNVYPYVPKDAIYPLVALGEEYLTDESTKNKRHFEAIHTFHGFSDSKNKTEINDMNNKMIETLSDRFPLGDGFYVSKSILENAQTLIDDAGIFHSTIRFQFTISKG